LLQIGVVLLLVAAFLTPVAELLDRWDTAGLGNDTELPLFLLVLLLCLTLLVARLVSMFALQLRFASWIVPLPVVVFAASDSSALPEVLLPPLSSPLRI